MSDTPPPPKPKKRFQLIRRIIGGLALLIFLVLLIGRLMLPGIIRGQVEQQGTAYLGTPVTLDGVSLSILGGSATLKGLKIKSPAGFANPEFYAFKEAGANISLASLRTDTVVVEELFLSGSRLNLEVNKEGKKNVKVLVDNLVARLKESQEQATKKEKEKGPKEEKPAGPAKSLRIDRIRVSDIRVDFLDDYSRDATMRGSTSLGKFQIDNIELANPPETAKSSVMKVSLDDFRLTAPDSFKKPNFLTLPSFEMDFDLGTMLATKDKPEIIINRIEQSGFEFVAEMGKIRTEDNVPENIRQFLHIAMNTASLEEPRRYEVVAKGESKDWFARLKEVFGNKQPEGEAKADKKEESSKEPAEKPSEGPPAAEEPPFKRFELASLSFSKMRFELIDDTKTPPSSVIDGASLKITNLISPFEKGANGEVLFEAHPFEEKSLITARITGELTSTAEDRAIDADIKVREFDLSRLPSVNSGRVPSTDLVFSVKDGAGKGTLAFRVRNLKVEKRGSWEDAPIALIETASLADVPEVKVPFTLQLKSSKWSEVFGTVWKEILSNVGGPLGTAMQAAAKQLEKAGAEIRKTTESVTDAVGGVDDTLKSGAKGVGSTVTGIFGKKKDGEETKQEDASPTPEETPKQ